MLTARYGAPTDHIKPRHLDVVKQNSLLGMISQEFQFQGFHDLSQSEFHFNPWIMDHDGTDGNSSFRRFLNSNFRVQDWLSKLPKLPAEAVASAEQCPMVSDETPKAERLAAVPLEEMEPLAVRPKRFLDFLGRSQPQKPQSRFLDFLKRSDQGE